MYFFGNVPDFLIFETCLFEHINYSAISALVDRGALAGTTF
jgi:hypothetical protein